MSQETYSALTPYRLPRRALGQRCKLRVQSHFLEATVFICAETVSNGRTIRRPIGTGFFVEIPDELDRSATWNYVVTARHCVEDLPNKHPDEDRAIWVRINTTAGVYKDIETKKSQWFKHGSADVATILLEYRMEDCLDFKSIALHWFVDGDHKFRPQGPEFDRKLVTSAHLGLNIEVGDALFFTGLFVRSAGTARNLPIARFGNISRMPCDEPITLKTKARGDVSVHAYLAESHSWGGHSGSPVFWHWEYSEARLALIGENEKVNFLTTRSFVRAFLGLVSAHFDIPAQTKDIKDSAKNNFITNLNAGIAVITPAENIKELLMKDEEVLKDRHSRGSNNPASAATVDPAV
jgi:hypothetical protein